MWFVNFPARRTALFQRSVRFVGRSHAGLRERGRGRGAGLGGGAMGGKWEVGKFGRHVPRVV